MKFWFIFMGVRDLGAPIVVSVWLYRWRVGGDRVMYYCVTRYWTINPHWPTAVTPTLYILHLHLQQQHSWGKNHEDKNHTVRNKNYTVEDNSNTVYLGQNDTVDSWGQKPHSWGQKPHSWGQNHTVEDNTATQFRTKTTQLRTKATPLRTTEYGISRIELCQDNKVEKTMQWPMA